MTSVFMRETRGRATEGLTENAEAEAGRASYESRNTEVCRKPPEAKKRQGRLLP